MVSRLCCMTVALLILFPGGIAAVGLPALDPIQFGGRFTYQVILDENSRPFPSNSATHSAQDRTRVMVDLTALDTKIGSFYIKGAARWTSIDDPTSSQKRFVLEQADYLYVRMREYLSYSVRAFANERRYFTHDAIAPLLDDDIAGETGANRGLRLDTRLRETYELAFVQSMLGDDTDTSRMITYLRGLYGGRLLDFSLSYLFDDLGVDATKNHAVIKAEFTSGFRRVFLMLSYLQSGFEDATLFFPNGSWNFDAFEGGNFSDILPSNGAAFAEVRIAPIHLSNAGRVRLVWRYTAMRENFVNDLGISNPPSIGHTAAAYYRASTVDVNARLVYHHSVRSILESETRDWTEGGVWGLLRNGTDFFIRGGIGEIDNSFEIEPQRNFLHLAAHHRLKRMFGGAHIMWKNAGTLYSEVRVAWDGKVVLTPNWAVDWRLLATRDFDVGQSVFIRLEYRPNRRLYTTLGVGRNVFGDDTFLLEDPDIDLSRMNAALVHISVRGDF